MSDPLAPRSPRLPTYYPGSNETSHPLRRWSSKAREWVKVEIAQTPALDARREAARLEAAAAHAIERVESGDETPIPKPPGGPWWRRYLPED